MTPQYPNVRLDFYDETIIRASWTEDGSLTAYPVAADDVVSACLGVSLGSGLLPKNALFWKQKGNSQTLGIFVPARRWRMHLELAGETKQIRLPMPPHIFVGYDHSYSIFAVKKRPTDGFAPLYHLPASNVHSGGSICQGNTPFPACTPHTIHKALRLFWEESLFNAHLAGGKSVTQADDVRVLWQTIAGKKRFPLGELMRLGRSVRSLL